MTTSAGGTLSWLAVSTRKFDDGLVRCGCVDIGGTRDVHRLQVRRLGTDCLRLTATWLRSSGMQLLMIP